MKALYTTCFAFVLAATITAQVAPPQAFSYSGVARDALGNPIATQTIGVQFSIIKTSPTGTAVYVENHFTNTDALGLFNLTVGSGAVQSGTFASIDWSNDNYYLKVGMDATGGSNFVVMGTTQLLSVPYALYAKSAGSVSGGGGGNNGYVVKFNGVAISDSTINDVVTGDFGFLTEKNYWYRLLVGTNNISTLASSSIYTSDTISNSPIYLSSNNLSPDYWQGSIVYVKTNVLDGFYYVPLTATPFTITSNLYYYYIVNNTYTLQTIPKNVIQLLPNNPTITGFNLTLPVKVTLER